MPKKTATKTPTDDLAEYETWTRAKLIPVDMLIIPDWKTCNRCGKSKPISEFSPDSRNANHRQGRCRSCICEVQKVARRQFPEKTLLEQAKSRAHRGQIQFNLDVDDIVIPETCPVLGIPLTIGCSRLSPNSPTLDRLVPSKGYVKGNVTVISWRANHLKNNASADEIAKLHAWMQKLVVDEKGGDRGQEG